MPFLALRTTNNGQQVLTEDQDKLTFKRSLILTAAYEPRWHPHDEIKQRIINAYDSLHEARSYLASEIFEYWNQWYKDATWLKKHSLLEVADYKTPHGGFSIDKPPALKPKVVYELPEPEHAPTLVKATPIGAEAVLGMTHRQKTILLLTIKKPLTVNQVFAAVRRDRNSAIPDEVLAADLVDLQTAGYITVFQ